MTPPLWKSTAFLPLLCFALQISHYVSLFSYLVSCSFPHHHYFPKVCLTFRLFPFPAVNFFTVPSCISWQSIQCSPRQFMPWAHLSSPSPPLSPTQSLSSRQHNRTQREWHEQAQFLQVYFALTVKLMSFPAILERWWNYAECEILTVIYGL